MNKCKTTIKFECDVYKQPECIYFKQDKTCPSTKCKFGLYERICINKEANLTSLKERDNNGKSTPSIQRWIG